MITDDIPFGDEPVGLYCNMPYRPLYLTGKHGLEHGLFAIVNAEDYDWAAQWSWRAVSSQVYSQRGKVKWYAYRAVRIGGRGGRSVNVWLHKELLLRAKGAPPSPKHIIGDHMNGNSLDCRVHRRDGWRDNLRWATVQMNNSNYNGFFAKQLRLYFGRRDEERLTRFQERGHYGPPTTIGSAEDGTGSLAPLLDTGQRHQDHTPSSGSAGIGECPF